MLNLYIKTHCPYCVRVLEANKVIQAPLTVLDTNIVPEYTAELVTKGGKTQVPFLEDTERNVSIYESLEIIEYLQEHYGSGVQLVVQTVRNVCPIE